MNSTVFNNMKSSGSSGSTEVDYSGFFNRISSYSAPDNYVSNPSYYNDYYSYNTSYSSSEIANPAQNIDGTEAMRMAERGKAGGGEFLVDPRNWARDHIYYGAEGELSYGTQIKIGLKNGVQFTFAPKYKVLLSGNYSNTEEFYFGRSGDMKQNDYGFAYYVGVNIHQTIRSSGSLTNTISIGAFGIVGVTPNFDRGWHFRSGFAGLDVSGRIGVGYGVSGALKLGFDF